MGQTFIYRLYLGGFLLLTLTLFYYQAIKGDYYRERARNNYVRVIPIRSIRGTIFDRGGFALAYDKAAFNISVIPYDIQKTKHRLFNKLAEFCGIDVNQLNNNYARRKVNIFSPVDIILDIDKITAVKAKEKFGEDILLSTQPKRFYSYPCESAHILGYVKKADAVYEDLKKYGYTPSEWAGFGGIEQYYDAYLKGDSGGNLIEVNATGKMVGFLGERKSQKGKDIYLTLDYRVQKYAYEAIKENRGALILLDSKTGEIIALVSLPAFNSNDFIDGRNIKELFNDPDKPLLNRAIQAAYPLGSTFKPIVSVAALTTKKTTPYTTFDCPGRFKLGTASFQCAHIHNQENLYDALIHSCNVYFYNLGIITGEQNMADWAKKFGLDSKTGIDLPYEKNGLVPTALWKAKTLKTAWFKGDTVNFSIGQGFIETTPLENTIAFNVFANDGYLVRPYVLKKVDIFESKLATKLYVGIEQNILNEVKKGLIGAVENIEGTARYLNNLDLKIAGKTGTAQTANKPHGWFLGFFPYDKPRYTIGVFLENCGSSFYAVKSTYDFLKNLKEEGLI